MGDVESQLVEQAVAGDRAAIQSLLSRNHHRLAGVIEARIPTDLRGVLAADDVCQEAYVAVFQQVHALRERTAPAFRAWLTAIVERKLVDAIRALRAKKRGGDRHEITGEVDVSSVVQLLDLVAVHERTPSRSVARREMVADLHVAMRALSEDHQQVLRLRFLEGLSVADTATQMARSDGAVVMLCKRALRQLGETIGDPAAFLSRGT